MSQQQNSKSVYQLSSRRPLEAMIYVIRGQKVMFDADLAALCEVPTKALNQAMRRNLDRFPEDFAFQLSRDELDQWRSQIVTSNPAARMGLRRPPFAFTQEGVAMLASVLRSPRAVQTSIAIVRAFVHTRQLIAAHQDLAARIAELERGQQHTVSVIEVLVDDIGRLSGEVKRMKALPEPRRRRIGFPAGGTGVEPR